MGQSWSLPWNLLKPKIKPSYAFPFPDIYCISAFISFFAYLIWKSISFVCSFNLVQMLLYRAQHLNPLLTQARVEAQTRQWRPFNWRRAFLITCENVVVVVATKDVINIFDGADNNSLFPLLSHFRLLSSWQYWFKKPRKWQKLFQNNGKRPKACLFPYLKI